MKDKCACGNTNIDKLNNECHCPDCGGVWRIPARDNSDMIAVVNTLAFVIFITAVLVLVMRLEAQADEQLPFERCIAKVDEAPVATFINQYGYVESSRDSDLIDLLSTTIATPIEWNNVSGAQYPQHEPMRSWSFGLILGDGTMVQFIVNGYGNGNYYGWMTYSTYRTPASYDAMPNPHVHCGFWSIPFDDINRFDNEFYDEIIRDESFEGWMR